MNRGIIQYTPAEKRAYYARLNRQRNRRNYISGSGKYTINKPRGRAYIRGQGKYTIPKNFFSAPKVGGTLGGASGAAIGNMIAPGIGGAVGSALGTGAGTVHDVFKITQDAYPWWDGYEGQKILLIDDFYGWVKWGTF